MPDGELMNIYDTRVRIRHVCSLRAIIFAILEGQTVSTHSTGTSVFVLPWFWAPAVTSYVVVQKYGNVARTSAVSLLGHAKSSMLMRNPTPRDQIPWKASAKDWPMTPYSQATYLDMQRITPCGVT